jgi:hypothetical protein
MRSIPGPGSAALAAATLFFAADGARAVTLYDGALNTTPGGQGWTFSAPGATETAPGGSGATTLSTDANNALQGGYTRLAPFALDRAVGYTFRFDVQVLTETHATNDRAGLSVIVLGGDKKGIELGFWTGEVWAQSDAPLFTHAEGAALNTTGAGGGAAGLIRFDLQVKDDTYRLFANGGGAPLLTGAVRDYTAFTGPIDPYETPNFLFIGDDTTSARGSFKVSRVEVTASVPEPGSAALLMGSVLSVMGLRRRRRA